MLYLVIVFAITTIACHAQQILIDRAVRVAGLWCFPLVTNPKEYLYIPADGHLSIDMNGGPEFSFMRYVENIKSSSEDSTTITEAAGGGVLHFLAEYGTPKEQVSKAEAELRKLLDDEEVRLRGPVIFTSGRYAIISSLATIDALNGENNAKRKMIATGNAPVLEGNKIAVSFNLDKQSAQILYNSFQMANPDVSVVFEMQFEGLSDAYDATVDIDWSEVQKDQQFKAGAKVYCIGAEVDLAFQRLMRNNAIKLISRGEHAPTEALLNTVYSKLLDLLFTRVEEPPPPSQQENALDSLMKLVTRGSSSGSSYFSLTGSYRLKEISSSGHTVLNFSHQAVSKRIALISFNIGDLYKKYGGNEKYFKAVNLADPMFSQREVFVSVDGSLLEDFDKYINSVTVTIEKQHENGNSTVGEVVVDRDTFAQKANKFSVVYGWNGDNDRAKWLEYQYRVKWSFRDGAMLEEAWRKTSSPMINVVPPYERREILIEGDVQAMKNTGVKYCVVKLVYDFFGKPKSRQLLIRVKNEPIEERIAVIQPKGEYRYDYEVRWGLNDGSEVTKPLTADTSGIIFVDELPR
ncbi:MAG: hypothetical protein K6T99_06080 [Armatimonadetes bacterium]|nr:hypothetical protein [Armatimonadota bacterium]